MLYIKKIILFSITHTIDYVAFIVFNSGTYANFERTQLQRRLTSVSNFANVTLVTGEDISDAMVGLILYDLFRQINALARCAYLR